MGRKSPKIRYLNTMSAPLFAVTGSIHSGKTSWALDVMNLAQSRAIKLVGVLQLAQFSGSQRRGYELMALPGRERKELACRLKEGGYSFDEGAFAWAKEHVEHCEGALLCVDELGLLEAQGKGHWPALERCIEGAQFVAALLVVRRSVLPQIEQRCAGFCRIWDLHTSPQDALDTMVTAAPCLGG